MATTKSAKVGDIVLYRVSKTEVRPLLVTAADDDSVSGQMFGDGTQVDFVEGVKLGKDAGDYGLKD